PAVFDRHVLALDITHVGKPATKRCIQTQGGGLGEAAEIPVRARREGPCGRRATEQRNELASPLHSITSSAMTSTPGGIVRPSTLAVLRLMTNSSLSAA